MTPTSPAPLELQNVTCVFGTGTRRVVALEDVSVALEPGELVAIMGPSGSDKSILLNVAGLLQPPTSGRVLVDGVDAADLSPARVAIEILGRPAALVSTGHPRGELTVRETIFDSVTGESRTRAERSFPTVPVLPEFSQAVLFTPSALAELGVDTGYVGTVLLPETPLTFREQNDIQTWVAEEMTGVSVIVSPFQWRAGWWPAAVAGVLGLGVLVVVTLVLALSWQESRRQFALLDAVGAPPALHSRVSGAFAGVLAGAGTSVGVTFGYLAARLLATPTTVDVTGRVVRMGNATHVIPDWRVLLILLLVTPLTAWATGSLLHHRKGGTGVPRDVGAPSGNHPHNPHPMTHLHTISHTSHMGPELRRFFPSVFSYP